MEQLLQAKNAYVVGATAAQTLSSKAMKFDLPHCFRLFFLVISLLCDSVTYSCLARARLHPDALSLTELSRLTITPILHRYCAVSLTNCPVS
jgi:hypothetical protein